MVSEGVLGQDLARQGSAPLAAVAGRLFGPAGRDLLLACAAIAVFGSIAADMINTPRAFFAAANARLLPAALTTVHRRFRTPYVAIAVYALLVFAFAVSGAFRPLAVLATISQLLIYLFVCLGVLRVRRLRPRVPGAFRAPGGPVVPSARRDSGALAPVALDGRRDRRHHLDDRGGSRVLRDPHVEAGIVLARCVTAFAGVLQRGSNGAEAVQSDRLDAVGDVRVWRPGACDHDHRRTLPCLPDASRVRLLRDAQPLGSRQRPAARTARLSGARHDQCRFRVVAGAGRQPGERG